MISSVRGTVLAASGTCAVIEVGGVGLAITVTPQHALALHVGGEATVSTALIVREDDLALFGFAEPDELTVFDFLRGVTGVGPKSAMGVLAVMSPNDIARAIAAEDDAAFRKVSGIGPKTAKLIIVSLAGKMQVSADAGHRAGSTTSPVGDSVLVALVGLGWPERVASQAIEDATASAAGVLEVSTLLRLALASLGPRHVADSKPSSTRSGGTST
jgi:Holliday junction DNA helicase RuvA